MEAVEYLKVRARMCKVGCARCILSNRYNGRAILCEVLQRDYPEEAVRMVEEWAKENPVKTYLSVLLEKFPNTKLNNKGTPTCICPNMIFKVENGCRNGQFMACIDCWNREYKEEE